MSKPNTYIISRVCDGMKIAEVTFDSQEAFITYRDRLQADRELGTSPCPLDIKPKA